MTLIEIGLARSSFGVTGRQFERITKVALSAMGREWHRSYLKGHFDVSAMMRYGYVRRRPRYTKHKKKNTGQDAPLVFSGEGLRLAQILLMNVNSKRAVVVLPRKFNFKNPKSRVDMRAELTKVLPAEADEIAQVGATATGRELDSILAAQS
jgi:hypothetical protein